jgi:hypothetical protein
VVAVAQSHDVVVDVVEEVVVVILQSTGENAIVEQKVYVQSPAASAQKAGSEHWQLDEEVLSSNSQS